MPLLTGNVFVQATPLFSRGILRSPKHLLLVFIAQNRVVPVKEPSVIIAASSEHRQEAINAVNYAIDSLKSVATIWKKV